MSDKQSTTDKNYTNLFNFLRTVDGADFLAALVASCFLGALPPVDFRAVCLVLAMFQQVL